MQIIAFNGFRGSGKNTCAQILSENHSGVVYQVGFADKLKLYGARTLGFDIRDPREAIRLMDEAKESWIFDITQNVKDTEGAFTPPDPGRISHGWTTKEPVTQVTGRQFLQNIGNEARELFGDTFWVDRVLPRPSGHPSRDTRDSENMLRSQNFYPDVDCLAITDLRYENEAQRVRALGGIVCEVIRPGTESDGHASEQPLPRELVDYTISNDGDFDDLSDEIYNLIAWTM